MKYHAFTALLYAIFILAGGMIGYVKAHSTISLTMGSAAGLLLIAASVGMYYSYEWALSLASTITGVLILFFGYRYFLKLAFFPSGLMVLLSIATLLILFFLPKK